MGDQPVTKAEFYGAMTALTAAITALTTQVTTLSNNNRNYNSNRNNNNNRNGDNNRNNPSTDDSSSEDEEVVSEEGGEENPTRIKKLSCASLAIHNLMSTYLWRLRLGQMYLCEIRQQPHRH
ncbi:unnamed protein product [Trifolium pratense]|uniref:Uncharacterized protein n=1 Tax=Trifolium pratense TaxID=57577 RepID=A0ACB0II50_TRIPR|nr:unnamed protein product [Trifolium pratense]